MLKPSSPAGVCASGTPLPKKLGLVSAKGKPCVLALMGEPDGFRDELGELPAGVRFQARLAPETTLAIWFVRSLAELQAAVELLALQLPLGASAWVIRPKSHLKPGFNEHEVREAGLARGLVDYKICSVDEHWSGMKFAWRKANSAKA